MNANMIARLQLLEWKTCLSQDSLYQDYCEQNRKWSHFVMIWSVKKYSLVTLEYIEQGYSTVEESCLPSIEDISYNSEENKDEGLTS